LLFIAALALEPRFSAAWRRRSPLMFYVFATAFMYLLCLGPQPRFLGAPFLYHAPYEWLMALPGYEAIRVPARFAMLAALCLAVSAGLSFAWLAGRGRAVTRAVFLVAVITGVCLDSWLGRMPLRPPPERLAALESLPSGVAIVELPVGESGHDLSAMFRAMYHGHPVVNGYSGFFPRSYLAIGGGLASRDPRMFDAITAWGPVAVVVDKRDDPAGQWGAQLASRPDAKVIAEDASRKIFSLPGDGPPRDITGSQRLPIAHATANVKGDQIGMALDGNGGTRWDSGPQQGDELVTIDLGSTRTVEALSMTIAEHLSDYPRRLVIETSEDGRSWTTQWMGDGDIAMITAVVRRPLDVPLTFELPNVPARFLRLRQLGQHPVFYWSIYELAVFGH